MQPTSRQGRRRRRTAAAGARPVIAAVLAVAALAAAGAFTFAWLYQTGPSTASANIRNGQTEVPLDQKLVFSFNRQQSASSIAQSFHISPAADGTLKLSKDRKQATFTPAGRYQDLTRYTVTLHKQRWSFTTTLVPRVVQLATPDGATLADGAQVPMTTSLKLQFNAEMEPSSVQLTANDKKQNPTWLDPKTALISLRGTAIGPLTLQLTQGRDKTGRPADTRWRADLDVVYAVSLKTVPLKFPALVQIDNVPAARDQSGLQAADAVFEYQTEGGITRFTALFTSAPESVGPVRSGRYISFKLDKHYRGGLFLSGLSQPSTARLGSDPVPVYFNAPYTRTRDRVAPENLYISGAGIQATENATAQTAFAIQHGKTAIGANSQGSSASVPEHDSTYIFDPATGTYLKTEDGHQMADALLGKPLHIQMVVVLHAREWVTGDIEDVNGVHARDFDLESGGRIEVYSQGALATGTWSAPDKTSPLAFKLDDGRPLSLPAGLVWIDVVAA